MPIAWVEPDTPLPNPAAAGAADLIAAGRDLSPARLNEAYHKGLFPWFNPGDPVLWWSPDPRMVLPCDHLHVSRSLAKRVRQFGRTTQPASLRVTLNQAFPDVMAHCAQRGSDRLGLGAVHRNHPPLPAPATLEGTWITGDIIQAYGDWHRQGRVHSVETWVDDQLVGGLYGVNLGQCFFGESMFSLAADASKVALTYLVAYLKRWDIPWIDCQQETPHLASLGARPVSRHQFLSMLAQGLDGPMPPWGAGRLMPDGTLLPSG
ncbi:MAG: leucyl/phenylalanyl-tRNA--protein transferase [Castellaniella sp.]|uniref:leucyl/phenylalanyl-tRNA--protein transferase n=1 Tax=Castellaniella sp. TaxID=1955812 RepID=UPI00121C4473|nr:leucyl/phenylalanyl-tRNA--protein transferase [Castellaniella sp.]TAN29750.1 MAG: leucyl/phenylalanyl-tRNA--protein transferase [Castellaniella sp.]